MSIPKNQIMMVKHHSVLLQFVGTMEWCKYCSDATTSIPTHQITPAEHHSVVPPGMGMREW